MIEILTRGLAQAGLEVHVAATHENGRGGLEILHGRPSVKEGVTHWSFPRQTRFYSLSWSLNQWLACYLKGYNLVHIHSLFSWPATSAAFWCRRYQIPYIVRPYGTLNRWGRENRHPWLKKISLKWIESRILAHASAIQYATEEEHQEAIEAGVRGKSVVIPNMLDKKIISLPISMRGLHPHFLFLSRLHPKKGCDLLLPAFARVKCRYSDSVLIIAGDGSRDFVKRLQRETIRLGIEQNVTWTGFLEGEEKWKAFASADIFVLPSYSENFGIAVAEAMSCGIPVIISNRVGIHQDVSRSEAGIVVEPNIGQLADAMTKLLERPELRKKIGENGRRLVEEKFTPEKVIPQIVELYEKVLSGNFRYP